jgi:hypothetical protein
MFYLADVTEHHYDTKEHNFSGNADIAPACNMVADMLISSFIFVFFQSEVPATHNLPPRHLKHLPDC